MAGALLALLGAEALLRALPSPTATESGYYIDPAIVSYPAHHRWRTATGWDLRNPQRLVANNLGFPAAHDFVADPRALALVGDSYVEASMLDAVDRPDAQLERALGGRPVYAFGGPGSSLLDYAERVRYAHERLGVRDFVVLMEAGDVRQSLCGSGNVHSDCLDRDTFAPRVERRSPPSALARIARESALAQYFVGQLRLSVPEIVAATFRRSVPAPTAPAAPRPLARTTPGPLPFVTAVADAFFDRVAPHVAHGRFVIIVDGRRDAAKPLAVGLEEERRQFIEIARRRGATVIDAEPLWEAHARVSKRSLSVGPYDGHLNPVGVAIVAGAAAAALR